MQNNCPAFTEHYNGRQKKITCSVGLAAYTPNNVDLRFENFTALWDTGAEKTVVTTKLAQELSLTPIGQSVLRGVNSEKICLVYVLKIRLPNGTILTCSAIGADDIAGTDILIGMDIISEGDFAISSDKNDDMHMSFALPSQKKKIDFVERYHQQYAQSRKSNPTKNKQERKNKSKARKNRR